MRIVFMCAICAAFLGACSRTLGPAERAQVQALRTELDTAKKEVSTAELQNAQLGGGLVKAMIAVRLEILKTNEALIQQRIHAIESGAKVTIATLASSPDPFRAKQLAEEVTKQESKVAEAEAKAILYSGGLVGALASVGVATERNSLAMLRQQYLIANHGLASPQQVPLPPTAPAQVAKAGTVGAAVAPSAKTVELLRDEILDVTILRKAYAEQDYQNFLSIDVAFTAKGLDRGARSIKGRLRFEDLFGEEKFALKWTIEKPIAPGTTYTERGSGFKYNRFMDPHQWVRSTAKENMKVTFRVDSILYEDGTSQTFE